MLYLVLIAGCMVAAALLLSGRHRAGWLVSAGCAVSPMIAYSLSRTSGLPSAGDDVGNWMESLGLASVFVEGSVALLSAFALTAMRAPASPSVAAVAVRPGSAASTVSASVG